MIWWYWYKFTKLTPFFRDEWFSTFDLRQNSQREFVFESFAISADFFVSNIVEMIIISSFFTLIIGYYDVFKFILFSVNTLLKNWYMMRKRDNWSKKLYFSQCCHQFYCKKTHLQLIYRLKDFWKESSNKISLLEMFIILDVLWKMICGNCQCLFLYTS